VQYHRERRDVPQPSSNPPGGHNVLQESPLARPLTLEKKTGDLDH